MNGFTTIQTEIIDSVGLVKFQRQKALNALNRAMLGEIMDALQVFDKDQSVGAIVLTGDKRSFSVGADVNEMANASAIDMFLRDTIALFDRIRDITKPVIAAVSGYCLGGGNELAMSCDMIIASESARFGQPEINLGVIPGAGGTQRLPKIVGKAITMEMVLNNRTLTAEEALRFGLVNHVVGIDDYLTEALRLGAEIASRAPLAIRMAKEAVNKAFDSHLRDGLMHERRAFYLLFDSQDQKEGMAAFTEKRPAKWTGM